MGAKKYKNKNKCHFAAVFGLWPKMPARFLECFVVYNVFCTLNEKIKLLSIFLK